MGMLNNPWFRVKIAKTVDPITQEVSLQFEHPTLAGMYMYMHIPRPPSLYQTIQHLSSSCTTLNTWAISEMRLEWEVTECSIT